MKKLILLFMILTGMCCGATGTIDDPIIKIIDLTVLEVHREYYIATMLNGPDDVPCVYEFAEEPPGGMIFVTYEDGSAPYPPEYGVLSDVYIQWTPQEGQEGWHTIKVKLTDPKGSKYVVLYLRVLPKKVSPWYSRWLAYQLDSINGVN